MDTSGPGRTQWSTAVQAMFDDQHDGAKWNNLYNGPDDRLEKHMFRLRRDLAVEWALQCTSGDAYVLDLGCGSGPFLELLAPHRSCVGVDASLDLLSHARERLAFKNLQAELYRSDCRSTGFDDDTFDFVSCLGVISYVADYGPVLAEISRILKPGGTAIVTTRSSRRPVFCDPIAIVKQAIKRCLNLSRDTAPTPGRFLDPVAVERDLSEAGLAVLRFIGIGFGPFKLAGHKIYSDAGDIRVNDWLMEQFAQASWQGPARYLADINFWICQKPA